MSKSDWSTIQTAETLEESRRHRFLPEMRSLLLQHFGLAPGMDVLEVGCGPGTLAPYLAEGVAPGTVTGLDLDEKFIERAREKAEGLAGVRYVVGDAYDLPFGDCTFDAVLSYTGLGVLKEPDWALREMIRVCRPGGPVSISEPVTCPQGLGFQGVDSTPDREPYCGASDYWRLKQRLLDGIRPEFTRGIGSKVWPVRSFPAMMAAAGLSSICLNAWGYCSAPDDARLPPDEGRIIRLHRMDEEIAWIESLLPGEDVAATEEDVPGRWGDDPVRGGLIPAEIRELVDLARARRKWLERDTDYSWEAGVSVVITGRKPWRRG